MTTAHLSPCDLRLLVSRDETGKPRAMLYQPVVPGTKEPIVLKSPTGQESFDAITDISESVQLKYTPTQKGFEATVTIPLARLGLDLKPGRSIPMDLGYIFGNKNGTEAKIRAYWVNNSFSANVVDDIPHESRLEPDQWQPATVE